MLEMLLFAIGIYYTPGPANMVGFGAGLSNEFQRILSFSLGVACALLFWFTIIGILGNYIIIDKIVPYLAIFGGSYILYLAIVVIKSEVQLKEGAVNRDILRFKDGLLLQLLNPKGMMVIVPVTSVFFPAMNFGKAGIITFSLILSVIGAGAPVLYAGFGYLTQQNILSSTKWRTVAIKYFNVAMGLMLAFVAIALFYEYSEAVYQSILAN